MPPKMETNEAEVSGVMSESENEYDEIDDKDGDETMADSNISESVDANGEIKKKYDPKDPMRPRRDERPCQRCIKRGLADQCQDGVRKKAKYLHDAPPEALGPVLGPGYNNQITAPTRSNGHRHPSSTASDASSTVGTFYSQANSSQYPVYSSSQTPIPALPDGLSFGSQQSPVSPTFQAPHAGAQMGGMNAPQVSGEMANFTSALFDPSNPAIFNFNLEGLNFGSQYSAMEFGMLNHMSSGAADTPPQDQSISMQGGGDVNFGQPGVFGNGVGGFDKAYDANMMGDFLGLDHSVNGAYSQGNLQHGLPHAYAIAARPTSLQSPSTENNSPQATTGVFDGSPTTATYNSTPGSATQPHPSHLHRPKPQSAAARLGTKSLLGKRQRDPSFVYESVKEPYQYVKSFHKLIAFLQSRFASTKTLSIAKSLASIRSPFISCTRTLNTADLVFMEKSFQRALFEYEEFMHQCSTPAIACRRTGEVAGVNKEFTALTGWTKDVLLGLEPNLNVNTGLSSNASNSGSTGRAGQTTPRIKTQNEAGAKPADETPQPVFLAELMDDDSVVTFYQDFAQLAFNNSRGRVTRKCRLLKYRTQESMEGSLAGSVSEDSPQKVTKQSILSSRVARIDGEHGISKLEKDGKLECSYTWAIKRDTFDIPMLIVVNFLPCYYRTHNQLAV
ncbi:hypothetical protein CONLIGDRAFT_685072 [Coniochaeta ligniaria NRRL 30616]|uniref:ERT1/acuK family PAS domain-containing protein n=1 Tax=Coniochaeta ligniaria NRRL 30616 TaxID=1408157 RepID=A0A1J7ID47_9PEZI|nr:hypothetical protein CONLIGDRAFT_685072 [Coniochaeta ligniaria NRRL 30616]